MSDNTILDLEAMLDVSMGSVETLPDYQNPPAGNYVLTVSDAAVDKKKNKEGKENVLIVVTYKVDKTIEVSDTSEPPVSDGTLFTERFQVSEDGLKYFKAQAMRILNVKDVGDASLRDVIDSLKNEQFKARIAYRKSESNGKEYTNINIRPFHDSAAT